MIWKQVVRFAFAGCLIVMDAMSAFAASFGVSSGTDWVKKWIVLTEQVPTNQKCKICCIYIKIHTSLENILLFFPCKNMVIIICVVCNVNYFVCYFHFVIVINRNRVDLAGSFYYRYIEEYLKSVSLCGFRNMVKIKFNIYSIISI